MDVLASECSSGCESGWTLYLEQSFLSPNVSRRGTHLIDAECGFSNKGRRIAQEENEELEEHEEEDEEEEDLSMVSDASSGPPQLQKDEGYLDHDHNDCFYHPFRSTTLVNSGGKRLEVGKENRHGKDIQELPSFLDDTASSPAFNFSKNTFGLTNNQTSMESELGYSQGFSATYFEGRSAYQENFGYRQPSLSGNHLQNTQWF